MNLVFLLDSGYKNKGSLRFGEAPKVSFTSISPNKTTFFIGKYLNYENCVLFNDFNAGKTRLLSFKTESSESNPAIDFQDKLSQVLKSKEFGDERTVDTIFNANYNHILTNITSKTNVENENNINPENTVWKVPSSECSQCQATGRSKTLTSHPKQLGLLIGNDLFSESEFGTFFDVDKLENIQNIPEKIYHFQLMKKTSEFYDVRSVRINGRLDKYHVYIFKSENVRTVAVFLKAYDVVPVIEIPWRSLSTESCSKDGFIALTNASSKFEMLFEIENFERIENLEKTSHKKNVFN